MERRDAPSSSIPQQSLHFLIIASDAIIENYNVRVPTSPGQLESSALAWAQLRRRRTISTGELVEAMGITPKQERELLSRMERRRRIARVRRGLYLIPDRLPAGRIWTPDDATAIATLMDDRGAAYQIAGPLAFVRCGYDDQIPIRVTVYNDALSGARRVGQTSLDLVKVSPDRLGAIETVRTPSGATLVYPSRERALVDAVHDWSRFDTLPRAYEWIRRDLDAGVIDARRLAATTLRYANRGATRRIAAVLERLGVEESTLRRLANALPETSAKIPLDPTRPARGEHLSRWGVIANG